MKSHGAVSHSRLAEVAAAQERGLHDLGGFLLGDDDHRHLYPA